MDRRKELRQEYLYRSVMTASPAELLVMLFDACIKNVRLAEMAMEDTPDYDKVNTYLLKAQRIITELISSLNMEFEISKQILPVYDFVLRALREANMKKDVSQLPDIVEILSAQRDTWQQIAKPARLSMDGEVLCG